MNPRIKQSSLMQAFRPAAAALAAAVLTGMSGRAPAQTTFLTLANPNWNITLSDYGYSDFLLDNTPGFEGREYLSGEWGAAIGYTRAGGSAVAPTWLDPQWSYPDWPTNSTFQVTSPIALTGVLNADGLPIAQSVIANNDLQITLRYEMLDTVTGTPMGAEAASVAGAGNFINSNRYVLKQTYTIKNLSDTASVSSIQFFQLLHGLQSQRGLYDNRAYAGPLSAFRYDVTEAGVDAWAVGAGSSPAGLEDFIGFHSSTVPSGYEIGYYGIEGNGIDNHGTGKPSEGVHLSIENNWQTEPYLSRLGTDVFTPQQRWIAGAERWDLGSLAAGASLSHDVVLSLRTGTRVTTGANSSGGCNGGSSVPGGLDYLIENVSAEGSCFGGFSRASEAELATRVAAHEFDNPTFPTPGSPAQVWDVKFSGTYSGDVTLTLGYDATLLPPGFDESTLAIYHSTGGAWQPLTGTVDPIGHHISVVSPTFGAFALAIDGAVTPYDIAASEAPSNSGTITGTGSYPAGTGIMLVATAANGYVFTNWTENDVVIGSSPTLTFVVAANRTLVAHFVALGANKSITTSSQPSNAGTTTGGGAYALNSLATVGAQAAAGYKFSKWTENGVTIPNAGSNYQFTVTGNRALVANFKPVYTVAVTCDPATADDEKFEAAADTKPPAGYDSGAKATVKVESIVSGYSLVNWTENGVVVSTAPTFGFNVTGNRELVAHFALGKRIDLSANPKTAGMVSGGGVYQNGSVPLMAEAKLGYIFTNWTLNGSVVSTSPNYDHAFPATADQALVANFTTWLPALSHVRLTPDSLMLTWPAGASGWVLQESPDLGVGNWLDSPRVPVVVDGENQVTISPMTGNCFFRLAHP